jgi:hypothetical protein
MLAKSPISGVTIRQRQSSDTMETQVPVKSIGASALPGADPIGLLCMDEIWAKAKEESPRNRISEKSELINFIVYSISSSRL